MMETILQPRVIGASDWATIIFVLMFVIIAIVKSVFESRFHDFMKLIVSDKYIKMYRDSIYLMSGFTIFLFVVQLISLAFFHPADPESFFPHFQNGRHSVHPNHYFFERFCAFEIPD